MEESGEVESKDGQHRWLVDPLDGTTNFLHGIPIFAVSIALERQGQIVAGVIYNPAMDELYTAERGGGAFLNDRRLRVAARNKLVDCVIGTGIPHLGRPGHGHYLVELRNVMGETAGIRRMGAVALDLAYVAAGRLDGFWEDGMHPWDLGAGMLMIREAGGFVSDKRAARTFSAPRPSLLAMKSFRRHCSRRSTSRFKKLRNAVDPVLFASGSTFEDRREGRSNDGPAFSI